MFNNQTQKKEATLANRLLSPVSSLFGLAPKPRLKWTPDLHELFVLAVSQLGGPNEAKPTAVKQFIEACGISGLTLRHVKSHLQKYRANCKLSMEQALLNPSTMSNQELGAATQTIAAVDNLVLGGSTVIPNSTGEPTKHIMQSNYYEPTGHVVENNYSQSINQMMMNNYSEPTSQMMVNNYSLPTSQLLMSNFGEPSSQMILNNYSLPTNQMMMTNFREPSSQTMMSNFTEPSSQMMMNNYTGPSHMMMNNYSDPSSQIMVNNYDDPSYQMMVDNYNQPSSQMMVNNYSGPSNQMMVNNYSQQTSDMMVNNYSQPTSQTVDDYLLIGEKEAERNMDSWMNLDDRYMETLVERANKMTSTESIDDLLNDPAFFS